jgi:hypothetical protein
MIRSTKRPLEGVLVLVALLFYPSEELVTIQSLVTIVSPADGSVVVTDSLMTGRVHVAVCLRTHDVIGVDAWIRLRLTSERLSLLETWFCPHAAPSFEECEKTSERNIDWRAPRRELNFSLPIPPNMYNLSVEAYPSPWADPAASDEDRDQPARPFAAALSSFLIHSRAFLPEFAFANLARRGSFQGLLAPPDHCRGARRTSLARSSTQLLIWNVPDHANPEPYSWFATRIALSGCACDFALSVSRDGVGEADVVLFSLEYLDKNDLPAKKPGQVWVGSRHENYEVNPRTELPDGFVRALDYYSSYSPSSQLPATLLSEMYLGAGADESFGLFTRAAPFAEKRRRAVMVVSRCDAPSGRTQYIRELMRLYPVDSYGRCLNNMGPEPAANDVFHYGYGDYARKQALMRGYLFALTFENALIRDYVSEKMYGALASGAIPLYRGAPNVDEWVPGPDSIIDVTQFESPAALAERLHAFDEADYAVMQRWRDQPPSASFVHKASLSIDSLGDRLCSELQRRPAV